jgi:hypothetical protein
MLIHVEKNDSDNNQQRDGQTQAAQASMAKYGATTSQQHDFIIDASVAQAAADGENAPWKYDSVHDFEDHNQLDDHGKLYMASSPDLLLHDNAGHADVNLNGIDAHITTTWDRVSKWTDRAIYGAAAVAGIVVAIGTGGLAAPLIIAAGAAWGVFRSGEAAYEDTKHGQSLNPFRPGEKGAWLGFIDPTAGQLWLGATASVSGFAALRPLALAGKFAEIGAGAAESGATASIASNLFGKGTQVGLYQGQLAFAPKLVAMTAKYSGSLATVQQSVSLAQAAAQGKADPWDLALFGAGFGPAVAGHMAVRSRAGAAVNAVPNDPLRASEDPAWLHAGMEVVDAYRGRMDSPTLDRFRPRVMEPPAFARAYRKAGGLNDVAVIDAFTVSAAGQHRVYLRSDRLTSDVIAHEIAHAMTSDAFKQLASTLLVDPTKPHSNLNEGVVELLATRIVPRNGTSPYESELKIAETIHDAMGESNFDKAVFQGDPEALALFRQTALSLNDATVSENSRANWTLAASTTPQGPGGGQPPGGGGGGSLTPASPPPPPSGFNRAISPKAFSGYLEKLYRHGAKFRSGTDRHVYVVATRDRSIAMNDSNIEYRGVIKAGRSYVEWVGRSPPGSTPAPGRGHGGSYDLKGRDYRVVITDRPYTGGSDRLVRRRRSAVRQAWPVAAGLLGDAAGIAVGARFGSLPTVGSVNAFVRGPLNIVQLKPKWAAKARLRIPAKAGPYLQTAAGVSFVMNGVANDVVSFASPHLLGLQAGPAALIGTAQIVLGARAFYNGFTKMRSGGTLDAVQPTDSQLDVIADRNNVPARVIRPSNAGGDAKALEGITPALTVNSNRITYRQIANELNLPLDQVLEAHGRQLPLAIPGRRNAQLQWQTTDLVRSGEDLDGFARRNFTSRRVIRRMNRDQVPPSYHHWLQVRIPDAFDNSRGLSWNMVGLLTGRLGHQLSAFNGVSNAEGSDRAPEIVHIPPTADWDKQSKVARRMQLTGSAGLAVGNVLEIANDLRIHDWGLAAGALGVAAGSTVTVGYMLFSKRKLPNADWQVVTSVSFSFKGLYRIIFG